MTKKSMGYPLPAGEAFTEELACMMIFIPDKDEYRQAFFSSFFFLSNWIAWENDPDKRGKDAARAWKLAVEATLECIEMNTCETILSLLTEIRDNTGVHCCDTVDISDGDRYTDAVEDGVGDVPQNIIDAGYASGVTDWVGYAEYKCMISHIMVDNMAAQLEQIHSYMVSPSLILGGIPTLLAIASTLFIDFLSVLVYSVALGASVGIELNVALALLGKSGLESLLDDMDTHHDALACSIYNADGIDNAVIALRAEVTALFTAPRAKVLSNLNLDAQLKALYAGRYDAEDIAERLADEGYDVGDYDCSCPPAEYYYEAAFLADDEFWDTALVYGWHATQGNPVGSLFMYYHQPEIRITNGGLRSGAGIGGTTAIEIVKVTMDYKRDSSTQCSTASVIFAPAGVNEQVDITGLGVGWHYGLEFTPSSPAEVAYNAWAVYLDCSVAVSGGGFFDNVRVWFNTV